MGCKCGHATLKKIEPTKPAYSTVRVRASGVAHPQAGESMILIIKRATNPTCVSGVGRDSGRGHTPSFISANVSFNCV